LKSKYSATLLVKMKARTNPISRMSKRTFKINEPRAGGYDANATKPGHETRNKISL